MKHQPTRAVGYVRVSTEHQADRGVSLDAQTDRIRAMATVKAVELSEVIVDAGESAKDLKRPGMQRLLELVGQRQVDTVIVVKLDRLTRSVKNLWELLEAFERRGVALVSVEEALDTATAAGRLVLNVMASVGQWEREAIGERTRTALRFKKARGERVGTVPFGYRVAEDGKHLVEDEGERRVLEFIHARRAEGLSLRAIATELECRGYRTRSGARWMPQYVAALVGRLGAVAS
jgi:site-specific DNA recombinase